MPRAIDVADCILELHGAGMSAMKLQKLCYYAQAYSLAWDDAPIFPDAIQAWAKGPVVRALFDEHRHVYWLPSEWAAGKGGDCNCLSDRARATVKSMMDLVGHLSAEMLSLRTHNEQPWLRAREGLGPEERCEVIIQHSDMREYYASPERRREDRAGVGRSGTAQEVGVEYAAGRMSLQGAAAVLRMDTCDAAELLDSMGCSRPLPVIQLTNEERAEIARRLHVDWLDRAGVVPCDESLARESVIASHRIEGVDARPHLRTA